MTEPPDPPAGDVPASDLPDIDTTRLERGMELAFGKPGAGPGVSVLARIEESSGVHPRVLLREVPEDVSPILRVGRDEEEEQDAARDDAQDDTAQDDTRYQVLGEIGRGGVGIVFLGRDKDLGRTVAMKVLRGEHAGSSAVLERFVEEAQIGGQLQHPGIVPVHELGQQPDGRPYFAMRLVKGKTLAAHLSARKTVSEERGRFVSIFEKVCQTIAYAHARGVIHRDLKPSNVMVGPFGEVLVVDWGFAKVLAHGGTADEERAERAQAELSIIETVRSGSEGSASVAGSLMGTPAYMPPEQAAGDVQKLDERSDVFALGAILCEILTGRPPYVGERKAVLMQALRARLDDARARLDACEADGDLVALAKRCLTPSSQGRPQDAGEVAESVAAYVTAREERIHAAELATAEAKGRASEAEATAVKERQVRRLSVALAASFVGILVIGVVAWRYLEAGRLEKERRSARVVSVALEEATRLRGTAQAAHVEDISGWPAVVAAAERAVELATAGDADAEARARAESFRDDVLVEKGRAEASAVQAVADRAFAGRLLELRARRGEVFDDAAKDNAYSKAFADVGLDVEAGAPAAIATSLRESPIAAAMVSSLDDWVTARRRARPDEPAATSRLLAVLHAADPDTLRTKIRGLAVARDVDGLNQLATEEDPEVLPVATVLLLGDSLVAAGSHESGLEVLRCAQRRTPDDPWANALLGSWLGHGEEPGWEEGLRFLSTAHALRPEVPALGHLLGVALLETGDMDGAMKALRSVVESGEAYAPTRSRLVGVLLQRSRAYMTSAGGNHEKRYASVERLLREALRHAPDRPDIWQALGGLEFGRGRHAEAAAALREAVRLAPKNFLTRCLLAERLLSLGEVDEAVAELRTAHEQSPNAVRVVFILSCALRVQGALDEAIRVLRDYLAPVSSRVVSNMYYNLVASLGVIEAQAGQIEAAVESLGRAAKMPGNDAYSCGWMQAKFLLELGRKEEAREVYEHFTSEGWLLEGGRFPVMRALGLLQQARWLADWPDATLRDLDRSRRLEEEALSLFSSAAGNPQALESLWARAGIARYCRGEYEAALEAFEHIGAASWELDNWATFRIFLAGALMRAGAEEQAREHHTAVLDYVERKNLHDPLMDSVLEEMRPLFDEE